MVNQKISPNSMFVFFEFKSMKYFLFFFIWILSTPEIQAQILNHKSNYTRQDSLRGSNTEFRNWWDVLRYDIELEPDFEKKFIKGSNEIHFKITKKSDEQIMQIDLQYPMNIDKVELNGSEIKQIEREGNVYFLQFEDELKLNSNYKLRIEFSGNPKIAVHPPWDGGWIFTKDQLNRPWMSVACQGLGASVWFPNKDYQGDEPDSGASLTLILSDNLIGVANGTLSSQTQLGNQNLFKWEVKNPINNYNIAPYIGYYKEITDVFQGEKGNLNLSYWVLDYNVEKAQMHFEQTKDMLTAFEHWMGPYPFYDDGFKIVEAPHLGMEHQSAIAYGNLFKNGYLGRDLSESGWGLKWDFILVHESAHEWFGNNITTQDIADMWVHEAFTSYAESLYTEFFYGKNAGSEYVLGTRNKILNDSPMIGIYGVNQEGSNDIYFKGANLIHTLRQWINNDELFREILRGLNSEFYHQTVTTKQIENYIEEKSNLKLAVFFEQYLRSTQIPVFEYKINGNEIKYRWSNCKEGFNLPIKVSNSSTWLFPNKDWKIEILPKELLENFGIDRNFYVNVKDVK